jgi:AcrR family transcriptional regulator
LPKLGIEPFRRAQIREAAVRLIARNGFYGTTLRDVAAAAEVSKGTIHHYYDSKLSMLTDTLVYVSEGNLARMEKATAAATGGEAKLRALIRASIHDNTRDARDAQCVWIWALAEAIGSEEVRRVVQDRRAVFQSMIAGLLRQMDGAASLGTPALRTLAAKIDAFLNGIETHKATGEARINPSYAEDMLVHMAYAWLETKSQTKRSA